MSVTCRMIGHRVDGPGIWNEGYYFATCQRCGRDLLRTDGAWSPVLRGYRVRWKSGLHRHAIASDFRRNLPSMPDEPRRWRLALHRVGMNVLCLPGPDRRAARQDRRSEKDSTDGLPPFLIVGLFAALGIAARLSPRR